MRLNAVAVGKAVAGDGMRTGTPPPTVGRGLQLKNFDFLTTCRTTFAKGSIFIEKSS
jgi:hypothetical protein